MSERCPDVRKCAIYWQLSHIIPFHLGIGHMNTPCLKHFGNGFGKRVYGWSCEGEYVCVTRCWKLPVWMDRTEEEPRLLQGLSLPRRQDAGTGWKGFNNQITFTRNRPAVQLWRFLFMIHRPCC